MILDLIPESARATGLGVLMKGAGKLTRFIPIPQPTLLVGPGRQRTPGRGGGGFRPRQAVDRHRRHHRQARPAAGPVRRAHGRRRQVRGLRRDHTRCADTADRARHRLLYPARLRRHHRFRRRLVDGFGQGHRHGHCQPQTTAQPGGLSEGAAHAGADLRRAHHRRHRLGSDGRGRDCRPRAGEQGGHRRSAPGAQDGRARPGPDDRPAAAHHRCHRHRRTDACGRGLCRSMEHQATATAWRWPRWA